MKRFVCLVVLMVLSSSAQAGSSFSFVIGGYRIRIDAPRNCGSPSCVSISIPGIYEMRRRRERNEGVVAAHAPTPQTAKPVIPASIPAVTPPSQPAVELGADAPQSPPMTEAPPAPAPKEAAAPTPPPAAVQPVTPPAPPPAALANDVVAPAAAAPLVVKVSREAEEVPADSPLGDWRPEGNKELVRIESCGKALCGYVFDPNSNSKGESVLINMKPKAADAWSGNVYSRVSGGTYHGTIAMMGANSLQVEACALGRFFCSGSIWSRVVVKPQELITSSQTTPAPRS